MTNETDRATIALVLQHTNIGSNSNTATYKPTTTVLKAFHVLEFISTNQPVKPAEIASRLGLTRTNVHRLLTTLIEIGYVTREENRGYRLTFKVFKLGSRVPLSQDLREIAKPLMVDLCRAVNENVYLTVLYGHMVIAIEEVKSNNPLSLNPDVTYTYPIHSCASGKNFLAWLEPEERHRLIEAVPRERRTVNTIVENEDLHREIEKTRQQGYATELMEFSDDLNSYSAPIFDYRGKIVANISVSGPSLRANRDKLEQYLQHLLDTAHSISQQLGRKDT